MSRAPGREEGAGTLGRRRRNSLLEALERLRALDLPRGFHAIIIFLYACENEGVNISELAYIARMRVATVARIAKLLAGEVTEEPVGPESVLFDLRDSMEDRRVKHVHLTPAGLALRNQLEGVIADAIPILEARALTSRRA